MYRIAQVSYHIDPVIGGQERIVHHIDKLLTDYQYEVTNIQPLRLINIYNFFKGNMSHTNINILYLPTLWTFISFIDSFWFLFFKCRLFTVYQREFLGWYSFNISLKLFFSLINLFKRFDLVVAHYHFHVDSIFHKKIIVFSHGVEWHTPPKTILDKMRFKSIRSLSKSKVVSIIANDKNYSSYCSEIGVADKVTYLPNFFSSRFKFFDVKINNKIIVVRNIRSDRGILEAIKAFRYFCNSTDEQWSMDIYGNYSLNDQYYIECKNAVGNLLIRFMGIIDNKLLPNVYTQYCLSLIPTQETEGTSISALESMACGLPTVSTPIGGLLDLPTFKSTDSSPESMSVAMLSVISDFDEISKSQSEMVSSKYSENTWNTSLINLVANLL